MRTSTVGAVLVASLGMVAACGGESSNDGGEVCDDPVCCAPVEFEPPRSRAYLVGDHLELYLGTRGEVYAPDQFSSVWTDEGQVDVQASSPATETTICDGKTESSAAGVNGQHCSLPLTSDIACGQELTFELAFRSTRRSPESAESVCAAAPFTTRVAWKAVVTCAECASSFSPVSTCDHPPSQTCSYPAGGSPFCAPQTSLPCSCGFNVVTGERKWSCAQC